MKTGPGADRPQGSPIYCSDDIISKVAQAPNVRNNRVQVAPHSLSRPQPRRTAQNLDELDQDIAADQEGGP